MLVCFKFDSGVCNLVKIGFGYVGIVIVVLFGVLVVGIDFFSFVFVVGVFLFGIGFGL